MQLNREELAWAAGFFDGEGCSGCYSAGRRTQRDRGYRRLELSITQADPQVLTRFRAAVGDIGTINGPHKMTRASRPNSKDRWEYGANGFEKAQAVIAMLWTWLSPIKREQAKVAITKAICSSLKTKRVDKSIAGR